MAINVDRKLLTQALGSSTSQGGSQRQAATGQSISDFAMNSANFGGGQARGAGLAAQLATAGIGAYTKYRAEKDIQEQELQSQAQFSKQFPQFADLASQLSPATRQAYTLETLKSSLKANDPAAQLELQGKQLDVQGKELGLEKTQAEIANLKQKGNTDKLPDPDKVFKNATALRKDFQSNSAEFQKVRAGFERVVESAKDPSAAGDLALIFNFMKVLDPGSTVREGEFATAQNSGSVPQGVIARYNKVINGERLEASQRDDFLDRAKRLHGRAEKSQAKLSKQFTDIAERNGLNPKDVVIDFTSSIVEEPEAPNQDAVQAELKKRGLI
jgi:hypothetical protein